MEASLVLFILHFAQTSPQPPHKHTALEAEEMTRILLELYFLWSQTMWEILFHLLMFNVWDKQYINK